MEFLNWSSTCRVFHRPKVLQRRRSAGTRTIIATAISGEELLHHNRRSLVVLEESVAGWIAVGGWSDPVGGTSFSEAVVVIIIFVVIFMVAVIAGIVDFHIHDLESGRIHLYLDISALGILGPDLVAAVIGLYPLYDPPAIFGHLLDDVARLPVGHRDVAIVFGKCSPGAKSGEEHGGGKNMVFHCARPLTYCLDVNLRQYPDSDLNGAKNFVQFAVSFG